MANSTSFDSIFSKLDICQGSINNAQSYLNGILEDKKIEQLNASDLKKISPSLLKEAKVEKRTYIKNAVIASIIALSLIGLSSFYFVSMQVALPYAIGASVFSLFFLGYFASFIKKINLFVFYSLSFHKQNAKALCLIESNLKEIVKNNPEKTLPPSPPEKPQRLETPSNASTASMQTSQVYTPNSSSSSQTAVVSSSAASSSSSSTISIESSSVGTTSSSRVIVVTQSESAVSSSSVSVASASATQLTSGSASANTPSVKGITEAQRKAYDNLRGNEEEKEIVRSLFTDIANWPVAAWPWKPSLLNNIGDLKKRGKDIELVHPFKFFYWIFSDENLKQDFKSKIFNTKKWTLSKGEFLERISKHPDINNLSAHLDVFINDTFGPALNNPQKLELLIKKAETEKNSKRLGQLQLIKAELEDPAVKNNPKKLEQLQVHKLEQLQLIKAELEPYFDLNKWKMIGKDEETFGTEKWQEFVKYLVENC